MCKHFHWRDSGYVDVVGIYYIASNFANHDCTPHYTTCILLNKHFYLLTSKRCHFPSSNNTHTHTISKNKGQEMAFFERASPALKEILLRIHRYDQVPLLFCFCVDHPDLTPANSQINTSPHKNYSWNILLVMLNMYIVIKHRISDTIIWQLCRVCMIGRAQAVKWPQYICWCLVATLEVEVCFSCRPESHHLFWQTAKCVFLVDHHFFIRLSYEWCERATYAQSTTTHAFQTTPDSKCETQKGKLDNSPMKFIDSTNNTVIISQLHA